MYPSLLAEETKRAVTEYLSTTFALADDDARAALEDFLLDRDTGIFRGPYLRVRTPFHPVKRGWRSPLDWLPQGFRPYQHQARAFERLGTRDGPAEPTIVTTETGSGKTEAFLYPMLDHVVRAKARGETGIKAVVLYPMNALVTDQARRLAELLHDDPKLHGVTAGVYIGGEGKHTQATREHLVDSRGALRDEPPDILLTNYKMLDLLLLRPADASLWSQSTTSLRYLILDEFHTYDGAQGTDVAMLLRRLGATLKVAEPGRPLGRITPVATSATLGGATRAAELRTFAETVFDMPFPADSVITEDRLDAADVVPDVDFELTTPDPASVNAYPMPDAASPDSWQALAHAFLGGAIPDRLGLGRRLTRSYLTRAVVQALADEPLALPEAVDAVTNSGVLQWGVAKQHDPGSVEQALLRFLALLSAARVDAGPDRTRPLLNIEVQLWIRELTRMLRAVGPEPQFAWWHDGPSEEDVRYLPAAFCRVCGRSGWQALATELGEDLEGKPEKIWGGTISDRNKVRTLLLANPDEPDARRIDPHTLVFCREGEPGLPVLVTPDADAAAAQRCPSCDSDDSIRFLGSSVATLVSVALTQLFGSDLVAENEKKTLVFTDSVQDAAHRAAFIEGRAFQFNLRSAILRAVGTGRSLREVTHELAASDTDDLYAVAPPDFAQRLGLSGEWLDKDPRGKLRSLLGTRLAFQTQLEVGLRSRLGRTLELTGSLGVDYDLDLDSYAELARATHENLPERGLTLPDELAYQRWILGLLDRLRRRGGIDHEWLTSYIARDGNRYPIWGGSPRGMQKFPKGRPAPIFFTTGTKSDFDSVRPRSDSWLTDWTERCLQVTSQEAKALVEPVVRMLTEGDAPPLVRRTSRSDASVFGLDPAYVRLRPLDDADVDSAQLRCPRCHHIQPTAPERASLWQDAPCPRIRCSGRLQPREIRKDNFYRTLYRAGRLRHLVTHEHTALLDDATRQQVERSFAKGHSPIAPNVLTCTPTLELGIDIGDLSTVGLASLPQNPASYLQRVGRAGRSTGNALVLATVPSSPRDLYYLSEPKHLINGEVTPPGAYLAATELLCRQYFAYCLDRVATGEISLERDMPRLLGPLFEHGLEEDGWLRQFVTTITARSDELVEQFLDLYGPTLDKPAQEAVRNFAAKGIRDTLGHAVTEWADHREELQRRLGELAASIDDLNKQGHLDDGQKEDLRRWTGESKALTALLHESWSRNALTGLGELSLLPNYNLRDDYTELDVSLWWTTDDEGDKGLQVSEHSYGRGSRAALTEFAPGAVFYARGYRVEIDALEIGPVGQPHWRYTRLCPDCGWGTEKIDPAPAACPRCGGAAVTDAGAVHKVLELRRVSAVHRRDEALIEDETEERTRTQFTTITGIDVEPQHIQHAWQLSDKAFGAEYVRQATIRTINVGRSDRPGPDASIAGTKTSASRFTTCSYCGVVRQQTPEDKVRHRGWCSTRRGTAAEWDDLVLSHQITTQAVRLLLPVSTFHVESRLTSLKAALLLGLRHDFGGDPQHLDVVTARMPDEHRRPRQFLIVHDTVPGGTGYLDRFGDPERMRRILQQAHDVLVECPCQLEERVACHRCLLGVAGRGEVEHVNRRIALDMIADLLDGWYVQDIPTVTGIDISSVQLSELELRFREQLERAVTRNPDQSSTSSLGPKGRELDIRLIAPDGSPRRWTLRPLARVKAGNVTTEPDFLLTRQDAQDAPVAVYLDGRMYHASAENDRTADDARKRTALRDDGYRVWSLTWDDIDDFARILDGYQSNLDELLDKTARNAALAATADKRSSLLWGNPMQALMAYLAEPENSLWESTAVHSCLSLMRAPAHFTAKPLPCKPGQLPEALHAWASGSHLDTSGGKVVLAPCAGLSGLPIAVVGSAEGDATNSVGALAVLDDRPSEVGGSHHEKQWRDWLRWSNLLQFLRLPHHGRTMVMRMAECWTRQSLPDFRGRVVPLALPAVREEVQVDISHSGWSIVIEYTDESLAPVGRRLAELGIPEPEAGGEVGDSELWQVEYCWPTERIAVVVDTDAERDDWLSRHGWRILGRSNEDEEALVQEIVATFEECSQ
ncbi:DEAD/DEAH box helicase [Haloechinothrix salitolerans]|uniref:DEAD/DEAH box helicase n=1 Tax=Haloechinothrix salitolerans TaxID=926830 RepID=A0ABW2BZ38_9PSEU